MSDLLQPVAVLLGVMSSLGMAGFVLNYPRAARLAREAESEGQATCRDCGHVGVLSYGLPAGTRDSSANIRLVCEECDGENWYVPGGRRDRAGKRSN